MYIELFVISLFDQDPPWVLFAFTTKLLTVKAVSTCRHNRSLLRIIEVQTAALNRAITLLNKTILENFVHEANAPLLALQNLQSI